MSGNRRQKIEQMTSWIDEIVDSAQSLETSYLHAVTRVHPAYQKSARNLVHYHALRRHDLRRLQEQLGHLGLYRLGHVESHVMACLSMTRRVLESFLEPKRIKLTKADLTY